MRHEDIFKIHDHRCNTQHRQHAFAIRVVLPWYKLPAKIMSAEQMDIFMARFDASEHTPPQPTASMCNPCYKNGCLQWFSQLTRQINLISSDLLSSPNRSAGKCNFDLFTFAYLPYLLVTLSEYVFHAGACHKPFNLKGGLLSGLVNGLSKTPLEIIQIKIDCPKNTVIRGE